MTSTNVVLYSFLAREAWVRMARARKYLKEKKNQKLTWRRDFRESRSNYRYPPFCSEKVFIKKRLEMC